MAGVEQAPQRGRHTSRLLIAASVVVVAMAAILRFSDSPAFAPYYGRLDPVLVTALAVLAGFGGLHLLEKHGWFQVHRAGSLRSGVGLAVGIATIMAIPAILLDLFVGFPEDTNVLWPQALLFYPTIAFVVESALHVLPLACLLVLLGPRVNERNRTTLLWTSVALVSLIEPTIQTVLAQADALPRFATAYVALHVFLFNVLELGVFRRYDFASMVALRIVYYLWWHVLWGYVRIQLLF